MEELVGKEDKDYKSPKISVEFDIKPYFNQNLAHKFGSNEIKKTLFCLDNKFCFLNHGAFGLSFKPTLDYVHKWQCYAESQPLRFYDREVMPLMVDIIRRFAALLKCKPFELNLVDNCTFAFNSVLNSMLLEAGDKIFIFSTTYGVYKKLLQHKCSKTGAILIEKLINFPILDEGELEAKTVFALKNVLDNDTEKRIKYIIVDQIPSQSPFLMPIQKIAKLDRGSALLIVDSAHALGSMKNFNFEYLENVDVLFTNCHKWFSGPKGTALLYRNKNIIDTFDLKSAVLSHGFASGFNSDFTWTGLKDYSAFLGLYSTLEIWTRVLGGFDRAIDYCTSLARDAADYLAKEWGTSLLVEPELCSTMHCVQLPYMFICKVVNEPDYLSLNLNYGYSEKVQNYLYHMHLIEVPIKAIQNKLYVRISAHVYNNLDDYKVLAKAVLDD